MEHVLIRRLEHLTGTAEAPSLGFAVEIRDRPGPAHKEGAAPDDVVWVQLHGGLVVARARVGLAWIGEFSNVAEVRARTRGSALHDVDGFWTERPRYGYAAVASLQGERGLPDLRLRVGPAGEREEAVLVAGPEGTAAGREHAASGVPGLAPGPVAVRPGPTRRPGDRPRSSRACGARWPGRGSLPS